MVIKERITGTRGLGQPAEGAACKFMKGMEEGVSEIGRKVVHNPRWGWVWPIVRSRDGLVCIFHIPTWLSSSARSVLYSSGVSRR